MLALLMVALSLVAVADPATAATSSPSSVADVVALLSDRPMLEKLTPATFTQKLNLLGEYAQSGQSDSGVDYDLKTAKSPLVKQSVLMFQTAETQSAGPPQYQFQSLDVDIGGQPKLYEVAKAEAKKKLGKPAWKNGAVTGWSLKNHWMLTIRPASHEERAKGFEAVLSVGAEQGDGD